MKKIGSFLVVLLGLFGFFLLVSSPSTGIVENDTVLSDTTTSSLSRVFMDDIEQGVPLIDVRTPEEFTEKHIAGAQNVPIDSIKNGINPDYPRDEKIYLYCRSGNRSAQAKAELQSRGFTNIIDLGAFEDVLALGGVVVQ